MNKRVMVAVCLIIVALTAGIVSFLYLKNVSAEIISVTESIGERYIEGEDFSGEYEKLTQIWDRHSVLLAVILKHSDADTLDRYFLLLEQADKNKDTEMFMTVLSQLNAYILVTVQGEAPRVENIF